MGFSFVRLPGIDEQPRIEAVQPQAAHRRVLQQIRQYCCPLACDRSDIAQIVDGLVVRNRWRIVEDEGRIERRAVRYSRQGDNHEDRHDVVNQLPASHFLSPDVLTSLRETGAV